MAEPPINAAGGVAEGTTAQLNGVRCHLERLHGFNSAVGKTVSFWSRCDNSAFTLIRDNDREGTIRLAKDQRMAPLNLPCPQH